MTTVSRYLVGFCVLSGAILLCSCNSTLLKPFLKTALSKDAPLPKDSKVAVLGEGGFLATALVTELLDLHYSVIERTQVGAVMREQALAREGLIHEESRSVIQGGDSSLTKFDRQFLNKDDIMKLGSLMGVDAFVLYHLTPYEYQWANHSFGAVTVRWVNAKDADIMFSLTFINGIGGTGEQTDAQVLYDIQKGFREAVAGRTLHTPPRKGFEYETKNYPETRNEAQH